MPRIGHDQRCVLWLAESGRWLKAVLLQAAGARLLVCDYCGSAIPVGRVRCAGCGATASGTASTTAALAAPGNGSNRHWLVPLLLCVFFPPALLVIVPILFWRWLRRGNSGWIVPVLVCVVFPPAVLLVAPALLWRSPGPSEAR